jgi:hypothetical protein
MSTSRSAPGTAGFSRGARSSTYSTSTWTHAGRQAPRPVADDDDGLRALALRHRNGFLSPAPPHVGTACGRARIVGHQARISISAVAVRDVRMLGPGVDLQLRQLLAGEPVARHHPLDRDPDDLLGTARDHLLEGPRAQPAGIAGVAVVELVGALVPGHRDLLRVDDDHEVAGVDVRRVRRLALAAQHVRDLRRQPPERLALGVDDVPVPLAVRRLGDEGLHAHKKSGHAPARPARIIAQTPGHQRGRTATARPRKPARAANK